MKLVKNNIHFLSSLLLVTITSWNGSLTDTNGKNTRPDVNFYGTLTDHSGKNMPVEDILIGGKYNQIPVYQIPASVDHKTECRCASTTTSSSDTTKKDMDPRQNKILLDLDEISSIALAHSHKPIEHERTINGSKYSDIIVTSITGTIQHFLVESSRVISCVLIDKGPENDASPVLQERKVGIIQIKMLQIKGKKSAQDTHVSRVRKDEQNSDKAAIADKTEKILDEIEKNVNTLSHEPTYYDKFKDKMASLLRSLRDQLQKMLNLIKN